MGQVSASCNVVLGIGHNLFHADIFYLIVILGNMVERNAVRAVEKIKVVINVKKRTKEKNKMRPETQKRKISGNYDSISVFRRLSTLPKDIIHTLLAFLIA